MRAHIKREQGPDLPVKKLIAIAATLLCLGALPARAQTDAAAPFDAELQRLAEIEADKRGRDFVVDDAVHELGTAFHVAGKGLVVIGSCSHRGIINTVRQAQAVSGVEKVHAIVGGFHLVPPQTPAQVAETVALMQAIGPDYIVPGHCSGELFIAAATAGSPSPTAAR